MNWIWIELSIELNVVVAMKLGDGNKHTTFYGGGSVTLNIACHAICIMEKVILNALLYMI